MARRKKNSSCMVMILTLPFSFFKYVMNYEPTPLVGKPRGRKKKKWI